MAQQDFISKSSGGRFTDMLYLESLACIIVVSSFDDGEDDGGVDEIELPDSFDKFEILNTLVNISLKGIKMSL